MNKTMPPLYPGIDYQHVLRELSVNRAEPCEVIRELISNSYDVQSSQLWFFPLLQHKGFIFIDNGTGLSQTKVTRSTTPYVAFFSIGKSTKQLGDAIGYKCQGSKLCFASRRVTVVTRCVDEDTSWRVKTIDNPAENLGEHFDISPVETATPWLDLAGLFDDADERTRRILDALDQTWFETNLRHGTCIIVEGYKAENYGTYFDPLAKGSLESGYLYNYIRHCTKHADTCYLRSEQGFPSAPATAVHARAGKSSRFDIWAGGTWREVPPGYPYLSLSTVSPKPASPNECNSLSQGTFQDRFVKQFIHANQKYALIFSIDGNRRRLTEYKSLGRRRNSASGIRLTDQCGVYISAHGVKCAPYLEILKNPTFDRFRCLVDGDAQQHYTLILDGPFPLVTNRNALTEEAINTLCDDTFLEKVKQFLADAERRSQVFRELLERLNKDRSYYKRNDQVERANKTKASISKRNRFPIEIVKGKKCTFVCPEPGEEHGVGALYSMLATYVETIFEEVPDEIKALWLRPLTFSGMGIDAVAVPIGTQALTQPTRKMLEYKFKFAARDEFNHPLCVTDHIVAWEIEECAIGTVIKDAYQTSGQIAYIEDIDPKLAYRIIDIETDEAESFSNEVLVVSLRELIVKTFSVRIRPPTT